MLSQSNKDYLVTVDDDTLADWWAYLNGGFIRDPSCEPRDIWAVMSWIYDHIGQYKCLYAWNVGRGVMTEEAYNQFLEKFNRERTVAYYNTTNITGEVLKQAWANAETQEDKIIVLFMKYPETAFTPFEVLQRIFPDGNVPVTSVRRALTNLTDVGKLIKTDAQKNGNYGKLCHCWKLNA